MVRLTRGIAILQRLRKKSQIQKFRETARALECDESEAAFDRALKRVAKASPPPKESKSRPKKVERAFTKRLWAGEPLALEIAVRPSYGLCDGGINGGTPELSEILMRYQLDLRTHPPPCR
jgi:anti-sigma factor RsiW